MAADTVAMEVRLVTTCIRRDSEGLRPDRVVVVAEAAAWTTDPWYTIGIWTRLGNLRNLYNHFVVI